MKRRYYIGNLLSGMIVIFLLSSCMMNRGSMYSEIENSAELGKSVPYAVKYKIDEKNYLTEAIRKNYDETKTSKMSAAAHITKECLYVRDCRGKERFDYFHQGIFFNPELESRPPEKTSLFKSPEKVVRLSGDRCVSYNVFDPDYMYNVDMFASQYAFPNFGLGVSTRGEESGFIDLDESVRLGGTAELSGETRIKQTRFPLKEECCMVEIYWGKKGLPEIVRYIGKQGSWERKFRITRTGEKNGYHYPKKAVLMESGEETGPRRKVEIEVTEFLTGGKALEKYSITPPEEPSEI